MEANKAHSVIRKFKTIRYLANRAVDAQNAITRFLLLRRLSKVDLKCERYGSDYGGWWIPRFVQSSPDSFVVVSCGLGHDISFDLAMTDLKIPVLGIEAEESWIPFLTEKHEIPNNMVLSVGTVGSNKETEVGIEPLISAALKMFGKRNILLKMDIEGSEFGILDQLDHSRVDLSVLVFELDYLSLVPFLDWRTRFHRFTECLSVFRKLETAGYGVYKIEKWNIHLVSHDILGRYT